MRNYLLDSSAVKMLIVDGDKYLINKLPAKTLEIAIVDALDYLRKKHVELPPTKSELSALKRFSRVREMLEMLNAINYLDDAYKISRIFNLKLHRAVFVACALREDLTLVSADKRTREVALTLGARVEALY